MTRTAIAGRWCVVLLAACNVVDVAVLERSRELHVAAAVTILAAVLLWTIDATWGRRQGRPS